MKSIFKITIVSLTVALTSLSCNDALDIIQAGEMNGETTFTTVTDMDKYLNGAVYTSMDISNNMFFSAQITDELGIGPQNSELALSAHQFYLDVTNGPASGIWLGNYTTINRTNRLLEGAKGITPATSDQAKYGDIVAQTRLIRAFSYFTLLSYFSTDMKDPNALGVMLIDYVPEIDETKPRVKNSEIFSLIDSDITYAEANLTTTGDYYRATKNFLNAFKARYYLYRGMYSQAKIAAQAVLDTSGLTLTGATPVPGGTPGQGNGNAWHLALNSYGSANPYIKLWNDSNQGENIFAISRPATQAWANIGSLFASNTSTVSGSVLYDMGRKTFNLLNTVPGDIRRYAYVDPTSTVNANYATIDNYRALDVLVIDKYPGKYTNTQALRNDLKVFRLSEMYFILAECAVEENDFATAATRIKQVRDARNFLAPATLPSYSSKQQAYIDILLERRKELYLEGHRYLDLKRLGAIAGVSIDRDPTDDLKTIPVTIPIDDYRMRSLPIPRAETQGNPTIQQNPGY
jgi:hypothetical protein